MSRRWKCQIRLALTYGRGLEFRFDDAPHPSFSPSFFSSEPSANFLQLRGRRRQGRRRTFPGFGFQCGARAFASQGGSGGGSPDALLLGP